MKKLFLSLMLMIGMNAPALGGATPDNGFLSIENAMKLVVNPNVTDENLKKKIWKLLKNMLQKYKLLKKEILALYGNISVIK